MKAHSYILVNMLDVTQTVSSAHLEIFGPRHMSFTAAKTDYSILPTPKYGRIQKHFQLVYQIALLRGFCHLKKLCATSHLAHVVGAQGDGDTITILGTHLEACHSAWEAMNEHLFTLRLGNEFLEATPFRQ